MIKDVIFDLDGTLALCGHRRHHVESEPKNWGAFFAECDKDTVNEPVARLFRFYRDSPEHRVWILSGRMGTHKTLDDTLFWLDDNDLMPSNGWGEKNIGSCFHIRQNDDFRPDVEVKKEMIDRLGLTPENTECVFDDRNCMVNAWRLWGFQCMQVAEGDF